jgi:hypothetical protein
MRRIAVLAIVLGLALPAQAHTKQELYEWHESWKARVAEAGYVFSVPLAEEYADMVARHPCRIAYCPPARRSETRGVTVQVSSVQVSRTSGVEQWRGLVAAYWPAELVEWALRIIACESKGDPWAKNDYSSAAGLFQFLQDTWDRGPAPALGLGSYASGAVYDPASNVRAAAWLYANWGGTSQWTCKA